MPEILVNNSNRLPLTHNQTVRDIFNAADVEKYFPASIAPDGVMRNKIIKEHKLVVHNDFVWPDLWLDEQSSTSAFQAIQFEAVRAGIKMLFVRACQL